MSDWKRFLVLFQAALARGEVPGPRETHVKTPLKETHLAMPIYQRLTSNELLQKMHKVCDTKCKREPSQHHMGKMFKETSAILRRVTIAVCEFNFGTKKIIRKFAKENELCFK
ncbi:uncharacterized protein TNCV_2261491 [Trichonephila clavipes]|nr:uncharacterized protein TNCV_2261491 [Trichonephila clavipes]